MEVTHYRHQKSRRKVNRKMGNNFQCKSCLFYTRPLSIPWFCDTEYILGLQAAKVNAEHGPTSLEVDFCLWLAVSLLFIQDKSIF